MLTEKLPCEAEIIRMLNEGHEPALRYVYDKYSHRIHFLVMKFLKSSELVQRTCF